MHMDELLVITRYLMQWVYAVLVFGYIMFYFIDSPWLPVFGFVYIVYIIAASERYYKDINKHG